MDGLTPMRQACGQSEPEILPLSIPVPEPECTENGLHAYAAPSISFEEATANQVSQALVTVVPLPALPKSIVDNLIQISDGLYDLDLLGDLYHGMLL